MGYRYGERKYSEGLYSRWPDWWRARLCLNDEWVDTICTPPLWQDNAICLPKWESPAEAETIWRDSTQPPPVISPWHGPRKGFKPP